MRLIVSIAALAEVGSHRITICPFQSGSSALLPLSARKFFEPAGF
jgi:hypothetical protein